MQYQSLRKKMCMETIFVLVNKANFGCLSPFVGKSHDEIHNVHDDSKNSFGWCQMCKNSCPYVPICVLGIYDEHV